MNNNIIEADKAIQGKRSIAGTKAPPKIIPQQEASNRPRRISLNSPNKLSLLKKQAADERKFEIQSCPSITSIDMEASGSEEDEKVLHGADSQKSSTTDWEISKGGTKTIPQNQSSRKIGRKGSLISIAASNRASKTDVSSGGKRGADAEIKPAADVEIKPKVGDWELTPNVIKTAPLSREGSILEKEPKLSSGLSVSSSGSAGMKQSRTSVDAVKESQTSVNAVKASGPLRQNVSGFGKSNTPSIASSTFPRAMHSRTQSVFSAMSSLSRKVSMSPKNRLVEVQKQERDRILGLLQMNSVFRSDGDVAFMARYFKDYKAFLNVSDMANWYIRYRNPCCANFAKS
jgi:hypothetical protein